MIYNKLIYILYIVNAKFPIRRLAVYLLLHPFCTDFIKQANSLFQELDLSGRG